VRSKEHAQDQSLTITARRPPPQAYGHPAVPPNNRLDLGQVDLVIFPNHLAHRIFDKWQTAMLAMRRAMVFVCISRFGQRTSVPLCPGLAPPGREPSRLPFRSVDGGFDDVRDVLSGRCRPSNRSINSGFVSRSSSSRFIDSVNHRPTTLARRWVITCSTASLTLLLPENRKQLIPVKQRTKPPKPALTLLLGYFSTLIDSSWAG
jgi:hypothetical protein